MEQRCSAWGCIAGTAQFTFDCLHTERGDVLIITKLRKRLTYKKNENQKTYFAIANADANWRPSSSM